MSKQSAGSSSQGQQNISWEEIKIVQNLIERCLQQYMTQTEIITALQMQANIEPGFTCLVWQKLEEQNPDFFYVYNIRLRIKDQIVAFNYLVDQQLQLLQKLQVNSAPNLGAESTVGMGLALSITGASVGATERRNDSASVPTSLLGISPIRNDLDADTFLIK